MNSKGFINRIKLGRPGSYLNAHKPRPTSFRTLKQLTSETHSLNLSPSSSTSLSITMSQREPSKRIKMRAKRLTEEQRRQQGEGTSRNKGKRVVTEEEAPQPTDDTPYFDHEALWTEYHNNYSKRTLVGCRFADITWLESVSELAAALVRRYNLEQLLNPSTIIYPNLTRAFYTGLTKEKPSGTLSSEIRTIRIVLNDYLWDKILGLKDSGDVPNKLVLQQLGITFNKAEVFRSMMKNPNEAIDGKFSVMQLRLEWRIIHYLLTWIILPRGANHARISDDDLILMWFMQEGREINWIKMIEHNLYKSKRHTISALPYATMISEIIHLYKIPHTKEMFEPVKDELEFQDKHIRQMGYEKRENVWVEKGTPMEIDEAAGEAAEEIEHVDADDEAEPEPDQRGPAPPTQMEMLQMLMTKMNSMESKIDSLHEKHDRLATLVDAMSRDVDCLLSYTESSEPES